MSESRRDARRQAVFLLYQHEVTGLPMAELIENLERDRGFGLNDFTREVVEGVGLGRGRIDPLIDEAASGWTVERIAPLERSILRVAAHEMLDRDDIPEAVAIDEAVQLAKRYCQADAGAFVNGVLGAIARGRNAA